MSGKEEITSVIENFYGSLYRQSVTKPDNKKGKETRITNVGSEEMPEIDAAEWEGEGAARGSRMGKERSKYRQEVSEPLEIRGRHNSHE